MLPAMAERRLGHRRQTGCGDPGPPQSQPDCAFHDGFSKVGILAIASGYEDTSQGSPPSISASIALRKASAPDRLVTGDPRASQR